MTTPYLVTWSIDVEADSPHEAAEKARGHQLRLGTTALVFEVSAPGKEIVKIDLWIGEEP